MRAYSEIIASFRRGGPFPIEADYIFETEAKLKEFYSCSLTYEYRIICVFLIQDETIVLVDIGNHNEVY